MSINLRDLFSKNDKNITLKIINSQKSACKVHLNLCDNLLKVRQYLENHDIIDDTFSFVRNYSENNDSMIEFSEIPVKFEENFRLHQIVRKTEDAHILYITCSKIWKFINDLRKLDYGCTMTSNGIKKASKRAFEAKNCKLEIDSGTCEEGKFKSESSEDLMMDKNLFFDADINVEHFVKLGIGMSIGASKNKESHVETNYSYRFTKYGKASLKLEHLEATPEFIKVVENAIESEDPEEFKQIIEDYGQFIPTEVILGGRVHYDDFAESVKHSAGNSNKIIGKMNIQILKAKIGKASTTSQGRSNSCSYKYTKVIGGKQPENIGNLNRGDWVSSLDNYEYWDCIEFRNPISIFQLLSENLRKRIIKSVGMKIHHLDTENHNCVLEGFRKPIRFSLNIPNKVAKIIKNEDIDFKIIATVTDTTKSKNDFFTCQVLCPSNGRLPSLVIHCVQKTFKKRYKLEIGWMVIGYYTDFNFNFNTQINILENDFNTPDKSNLIEYDSKVPICLGIPVLSEYPTNESIIIGYYYYVQEENNEYNKIRACTFAYCLEGNRLVELPKFTFYTLKITNYHIHSACNTIPLEETKYNNFNTKSPKFVSIYSKEQTNCVFLKQRNGQIRIKNIGNSIDKTKLSVKCAFFDPFIRNGDLW
ncbi:hypothetical protein RirG_078110 [Rhizophagus irregularis DAOM 197198w]|uniref:Uncharacterized protein n=1 Tax=Rhizophagus irregularis (strain DAOM 197198w) TaxID=1432141 RepID=A0A015LFY8_RHIIW|nr:hypothetical protein RirG_078110 [Rhizophagus irregularis DAOM 197198w]